MRSLTVYSSSNSNEAIKSMIDKLREQIGDTVCFKKELQEEDALEGFNKLKELSEKMRHVS